MHEDGSANDCVVCRQCALVLRKSALQAWRDDKGFEKRRSPARISDSGLRAAGRVRWRRRSRTSTRFLAYQRAELGRLSVLRPLLRIAGDFLPDVVRSPESDMKSESLVLRRNDPMICVLCVRGVLIAPSPERKTVFQGPRLTRSASRYGSKEASLRV